MPLFPALVITHLGGQLSTLGRKLLPIKKINNRKIKYIEDCGMFFLFWGEKQPLYCTYTESNNNHMNIKYLVIFPHNKRLPFTLSTENNSSPPKVILLFPFIYYFHLYGFISIVFPAGLLSTCQVTFHVIILFRI